MSDPAKDRLLAACIAIAVLATWEIGARRMWIDALIFPPPSRIAEALVTLIRQDLFHNIGISLLRFFGGVIGGSIPGILLGLCIGWLPRLHRVVDPFIAAIHPLPKIVLFPLFIVIFGVSEWAKIASIALTVFFPTLINSSAGARAISPLYLEVIRNYGGTRFDAFRHVVLPGSLPMILNGIRIATNLGLLVTIAIEFTVMSPGIGSIIWLALQTMRTENLYAGVVIISILGISVNAIIQTLLRRVTPWQQ
ncbi:MAG TPA: ABC transporter permease [Thermoanaerobaculia bacterium]|nr:ABC transporter permease [Thermoanaerobaculia bacterium]